MRCSDKFILKGIRNENKKKFIIIINIILLISYYMPLLFMYLHTEYIEKDFDRLDLKYTAVDFIKEHEYSLRLYDYDIVFQTDKDYELQPFLSYNLDVWVNQKKINEIPFLGLFDKFSISSVNILNMDRDPLNEIYLYSYDKNEYDLIDFYKTGDEIKYRLTKTDNSTFLSKYFNSYKSNFFSEAVAIGIFFYSSLFLTGAHALILSVIFIIIWIKKYMKERKDASSI